MARVKGGKLTATYDSTKRQPLDSRMLVTKRADLINPAVWVTSDSSTDALFNGLIVAVNTDGDYNGVYYLADRLQITDENYANYQAAVEAGTDLDVYFTMWIKLAKLDEVTALVERITAIETNGVGGGISQETLDQAIDDAKTIRVHSIYELPNVGAKDTFYLCESDGVTYTYNEGTGAFDKFAVREIKEIDGGDAHSFTN